MRIIDAHHHFWKATVCQYTWLGDESLNLLWGKPTNLPRDYFAKDLVADAGAWELEKSVHVQCYRDLADPVEESKWLQSLADDPSSKGYPHAIVAFADFSSPDVEETLSQHCEYKNVRGMRQNLNRHPNEQWHMSDRDYMLDESWCKRFGLLEKYQLSFDLQLYYHQVPEAIQLIQRYPNILFILNHAGMPADRDSESINAWRSAMQRLALCENVVAKISGLGMCDRQWTVDSIRPFVTDIIEAFGVDRCMFGSNFPVDVLFSDYQTVWNAYDTITSDLSAEERAMLFHENAERYYQI
ncbi:MAG: amidohydrolase family protein [Opitutales bacterium]|jgi:predicted TIM-barrel fold metal-dependent hydrolase|nr:amidohydrolase family protein [Opitutales bacterium]MBT5814549.1 amidohydrolase family protein [Opitutales bacterium]MBT7866301.1 amidohydrolase family protein [Opitutales bacterium]